MTTMDRKHPAALARQAAALRQVWLREREERRAMQFAANAEFRWRWLESDLTTGELESTGLHREEDEAVAIQS